MAYVLPTEDEEKEAQQAGAQAAPALGGGVIASTSQASTSAPKAPDTSSGFISFDRVMAANKDAAKKSAEKVAGGLAQKGQQARQGVQQASQAFGQQVQAGMPTYLQPGVPQKPAQQSTGKAAADPYAPVAQQQAKGVATPQSPQQAKGSAPSGYAVGTGQGYLSPEQAAQMAQAKYTGPEAMSDSAGWEDLLGSSREAQRQAAMTGQRDALGGLQGDAGLQTLLEEQVSGPYSKGESRFDAALLGRAGRRDFDALSDEYGDLLGETQRADEASRAMAGEARGRVESEAAQAKAALDKYGADNAATAEANRLAGEQSAQRATEQARDVASRASRPAWGQFEVDRLLGRNSGPGGGSSQGVSGLAGADGLTRSSHAGVFSDYGGSQKAWEGMTASEYERFNELMEASRFTMPGDPERYALEAYVKEMIAKYGRDGQVTPRSP